MNLVVARCRDIDATRAFYDCLGFEFERHSHGTGPEHYAHEDARGVFELYPVATGKTPDTAGLGFSHPDLDSLSNRFADLGLQPTPPTDHPWGRTFVVRDPDGRRVELKQSE
jgi:lactoylglutathione lyase